MNNYNLLTRYLVRNNQDEVIIRFDDFERNVGIRLPDFVDKYPSRFFYNDHSNSYYKYWNSAGYYAKPNKRQRLVSFVRTGVNNCRNNDNDEISTKRCNNCLPVTARVLDANEIESMHNIVENTFNYGEELKIINRVFNRFPLNNDIDEVAIKIAIIDITHSTQISKYKSSISLNDLAMLITSIKDFDKRVAIGDAELVNDIARGSKRLGIGLFSFATKYCCYHNTMIYQRDDYSIYDSLVVDSLTHYVSGLTKSRLNKCRVDIDYKTYNDIIGDLLDANDIHIDMRRRKFDHYIWYNKKKESVSRH